MLATIETGVELRLGERNCAGLPQENFTADLASGNKAIRACAHRICAACTQIGSDYMCPTVPAIVEFGLDDLRKVIGDTCQTRENSVGVR